MESDGARQDPSRPLSGQTAVVTGASSGIGRAVAERLGAAGAYVVLGGRTASAMDDSVAAIAAAGGRAEARVFDVRDVEATRAFVNVAQETTGRLDVMVNNAGVSFPDPILDADPEGWRAMFETNLLGLLVGTQAAVRAMRDGGRPGRVVMVSSVAALRPDSGVYGATKHAVNTIANTLRKELADDPIQVVTVMPGAVATSFARNFDPAVLGALVAVGGGQGPGQGEVVRGERLDDATLRRARESMPDYLLAPEDVAEAVLWAVTQPGHVNIGEVVVRPKRDLPL